MLSDKSILQEMEAGNIVIEPFDIRSLGTNSYDVRLGEWFVFPRMRLSYTGSGFLAPQPINFWKESDAKRFWNEPVQEKKELTIYPGETVLAVTEEVVGGTNGITTSMRARSSIVRSCLAVAKCGGLGDVGYISKWTMEISNFSHSTLIIPVGMRVAQMEFFRVGETIKEYSGKYGSRTNWTPQDMLPKLYKDRELNVSN